MVVFGFTVPGNFHFDLSASPAPEPSRFLFSLAALSAVMLRRRR